MAGYGYMGGWGAYPPMMRPPYGSPMGYGWGGGACGWPASYGPSWAWGGWGLGGLRQWGGTYSSQFATSGLPTDEEITEMIYDAIDDDPLIPWDADIDVSVDAGEVTLGGTVTNKRIKHAAGDDSWWVPGVTDVHNKLVIVARERRRRHGEAGTGTQPGMQGRPSIQGGGGTPSR